MISSCEAVKPTVQGEETEAGRTVGSPGPAVPAQAAFLAGKSLYTVLT